MNPKALLVLLATLYAFSPVDTAVGSDWPRFRGPNGSGVGQALSVAVTAE